MAHLGTEREWPICLTEELAILYNDIEDGGKWPDIGNPIGVLLPKGGSLDTSDKADMDIARDI